jgi:SAM-dependent methyltransferase
MQTEKSTTAALPRYVRGSSPRGLSAVFPSGEPIDIERGRRRSYPGLKSEAPDTRAIYAAVGALFPEARRVVDLGCGSGLGTAELCSRHEQVTALDVDETAVRFARAYVPGANVPELSSEDAAGHDLVCIVDVLGHADEPVDVLRRARRLLGSDGKVFVAEPRAFPAQALLPPARRAYSRQGLEELLTRSGLELERWVDDIGHFVACAARPAAQDGWRLLEAGDRARRAGDREAADSAYSEAASAAVGVVSREGLLGSAVARAEQGQMDAAAARLLEAAQQHPGDVRVLAGLAELCLLGGETFEALGLAVRALEDDPCNANAMQVLARAAGALQQNEAYASYRIASSLAPADRRAATELARLAAQRGEIEYAIWVLERLRSFDDGQSADFHVTLGWLHVLSQRPGDARVEADIARIKQPGSQPVKELLACLDELAETA